MRPCTTHHHACDCREAAHAATIERMLQEIEARDAEIARLCEAYRSEVKIWCPDMSAAEIERVLYPDGE